MKEYPLEILKCVEYEGSSIMAYYSKGHHDRDKFVEELLGDYEYKTGYNELVRKCFAKVIPCRYGNCTIEFTNTLKRGGFPITVIEL